MGGWGTTRFNESRLGMSALQRSSSSRSTASESFEDYNGPCVHRRTSLRPLRPSLAYMPLLIDRRSLNHVLVRVAQTLLSLGERKS